MWNDLFHWIHFHWFSWSIFLIFPECHHSCVFFCLFLSFNFFLSNLPLRFKPINSSAFADQRLNDIVGSAYYVAPEVLHRSYSIEADMWSIGVITYILLCGSRPFWARTESGIFRSVLRADPNFEDSPWPSVSAEARDFVKRLLNKDHRKRMTASQALGKLLCVQCIKWFCDWEILCA